MAEQIGTCEPSAIKGMARMDVVNGLLFKDDREEECPTCVEGKIARGEFRTHKDVREKPLKVVRFTH